MRSLRQFEPALQHFTFTQIIDIASEAEASKSDSFGTFSSEGRVEIIVKHLAILSFAFFAFVSVANGQIRQAEGKTVEERSQQKALEIERTEQERRRIEAEQGVATADVKPAVMNVDVQMALTKLEYKNFAEAKPNISKEITDGDNLWLYVKFNGKLERYVYRLQEDLGERYVLFVEYGPEGDTTAKSHQVIEFRKDELNLTELKMSLSPGRAGNNRALAIFSKNVSASKPGRWSNELRITNKPGLPRGINDYLAKVAFVCDFTRGFTKYPKMTATFESMVLRDTLDESKLPIAGTFDDQSVLIAINERLAAEKITPTRIYFAGDNWLEYSDLPTSQRQFRTVTGVVQYQAGAKCLYGTATVLQVYNQAENRYGNSIIAFRKDILTTCDVARPASR